MTTNGKGGPITRRDVILAGTSIGAFSLFGESSLAGQNRKPNILFILADDLGYADVSCYGRTEYKTPAIDSLATAGLRFTQAYANSAVCSATRTAIITGRYQDRLAIGLEEPLTNRDVGLPPSHPTLPSLLRAAGYSTSLIGKWHLGQPPKYSPLLSGYDHFWGFRGGALDYFNHDFAGHPDLWDDDRPIHEPGYLTQLLGDKTVEVIEKSQNDSRPWFISLHFSAPHWPWEGPNDEAESKRLAAAANKIVAIEDLDGGSMATFAGMVTAMDAQIGRVLTALDQRGLAENTIVVFTSDNGGERYSNTWPLTGKKGELLEGGIRIPAIVRWQGHIPAGVVSEQVIASMDWLPTLLSTAGTAPASHFPTDGMNLAATNWGVTPTARTLCWRYMNLSQEACRVGDWKYLKVLNNTFLFNVADDPLERANMKDRRPDLYRKLHETYQAWNAQMLPIDPNAFTMGFTGAEMVDHYGITQHREIVD